jgi:outer membrane lipoprotein SlyB
MKQAILLLVALILTGCATNPGLDHRITCSLDGKATFIVTYGPLAVTNPVADADALCAKMQTASTLVVSPAAVSASAPK